MATKKEYAYYKKGNKFALIQKNITSANNAITDDTYGRYKSPVASVTDGIQLEYVYSRDYSLPENITTGFGGNKLYLSAWTVVDGYLTFVHGHTSTITPYLASSYGIFAVDEYLVIGGSSRWNGKHKVKSVTDITGTHGGIQTYTKVNQQVKSIIDTAGTLDWNADETITGVSSGAIGEGFLATDYIWITGGTAIDQKSKGLYTGLTVEASVTTITFTSDTTKIGYKNQWETVHDTPKEFPFGGFDADANINLYMREAFLEDGMYAIANINSLNDEDDTIDLSPYLSKALVYYIKARLMEDQLNFEGKEYFMREFRRMVEKHSSATSLTGGTYRIQGHGMTK